ncbi:MAG: hypothetical protein COA96_04540 [SAR86 cluster bacterium]|uniref:Uncharacterized protein n=1 Tax=SAR86 cluster bacterium TaxID=2030880 RepID=A0A2A5B5Z1_9GAMM|nr:MAG: hypothetical protein COA96_04540 [SAR86 cluster bacterium]
MHILKSLLSILAISFSAFQLFAATEFEGSIPVELAQALLTNPTTIETRIYIDILDEFPKFQIPNGFEVLGSVDQGYSQRVVLTTKQAEDEAILLIVSAFEDVDFVQFDVPFPGARENGFLSPQPRAVHHQLCHDSLGNLSVSYIEVNNINLISLSASVYRNHNQGNCAQQAEQIQMSMVMMGNRNIGIREYIPRMEAPDDAALPPFAAFISGSGFSSSNNEAETEANLNIEWGINEVYAHFEDQINAQGWEIDSQNIGSTSAIGTWTRSPEPNLSLVGMLTVLKIAESSYKLTFKLLATGGRSSNSLFIGSPRQIRN